VAVADVMVGVGLGGKPHYIHWGWFQISAANVAVIVAMLLVFAVALLAPFPRGRR
jgi:hypothetical protein